MSTRKRRCRECHKPHGKDLPVCVECSRRLKYYEGEKQRQEFRSMWSMAVRGPKVSQGTLVPIGTAVAASRIQRGA